MATVIILTSTALSSWTVPSDWNPSNNSIECIGPGYDGENGGTSSNTGGDGGGGGAYAKISNVNLTPGSNVSIRIGDRSSTLSTYLKNNAGTTVVEAAAANGATAGAAGSSTGDVKYSGGAGGTSSGHGGGGGGGAAGPSGAGKAGGAKISGRYPGAGGGGSNGGSSSAGSSPPDNSNGGTGGNGTGGTGGGAAGASSAGGDGSAGGGGGGGASGNGGNGGADTCFDVTHGAGGGGAGGSGSSSVAGKNGGNGGGYGSGGGGGGRGVAGGGIGGQAQQGIIVITYASGTQGDFAATEAADTMAASGLSAPRGAFAATETADTMAGAGAERFTGSFAASEAADGMAGAGKETFAGSFSASEAADGMAATGKEAVIASMAAVEAADGMAAAAILTERGVGGFAEAADGMAGIGLEVLNVTVSLVGSAASPGSGKIIAPGALDLGITRNSTTAVQYLIELYTFKGGQGASGGLETVSEIPVASLPKGSGTTIGEATLRYADRHWVGDPADTAYPNVFFEGRVTTPILMDRQAPIYPEESRRIDRQFGAIEIINADGAFDLITKSYFIDGRRVQIRLGPYMADYSQFAIVADCLATSWTQGDDIVRIALRDQSYTLDNPAQSTLYLGTGGAEGTAELTGKPKPMLYGYCPNVTAVQIDPLQLIYQVHDSLISSVDQVYDRGTALTLDTSVGTGGNVANHAALEAATVGASKFVTCLAEGKFKLGSSPLGVITADVKGDATDGYTDAIGTIAMRLLARAGLSADLVDAPSFDAVPTWSAGIYVNSTETKSTSEMLNQLLGSVAGSWGSARNGKIRATLSADPDPADIALSLDQYDILSIKPEAKPVPRWRQRVAYGRNWTVQTGNDVNVAVADDRKQYLAAQYRIATSGDGRVFSQHAAAADAPVLETLLNSQADAQALADQLIDLFGAERDVYRVVTKRKAFVAELGKTTRIAYPRQGLTGGKNFIVKGMREDAAHDEIELRVWG